MACVPRGHEPVAAGISQGLLVRVAEHGHDAVPLREARHLERVGQIPPAEELEEGPEVGCQMLPVGPRPAAHDVGDEPEHACHVSVFDALSAVTFEIDGVFPGKPPIVVAGPSRESARVVVAAIICQDVEQSRRLRHRLSGLVASDGQVDVPVVGICVGDADNPPPEADHVLAIWAAIRLRCADPSPTLLLRIETVARRLLQIAEILPVHTYRRIHIAGCMQGFDDRLAYRVDSDIHAITSSFSVGWIRKEDRALNVKPIFDYAARPPICEDAENCGLAFSSA